MSVAYSRAPLVAIRIRLGPECMLFAVIGDLGFELLVLRPTTTGFTLALVNLLFYVESNRSWFINMPSLLFGVSILIA